jgi:SAM-dependent methyltransferase
LLASDTVVNAKMNRDRGFSGVNSYERELNFDITAFLQERVHRNGNAAWYDACCGSGRALREAAARWAAEPWAAQVTRLGVDLWDDFPPAGDGRVRFTAADVVGFHPPMPVDLITCVHGVHYLGDKLAFLENVYAHLRSGGVFVGHLDPANLRSAERPDLWPRLLRRLRNEGVVAALRSHHLRIEKTETPLQFGVRYRGAHTSAAPNFSGMVAVDSWYEEPPVG